MVRRRGDAEPAFGSDSFLDILANMVGILIILIVIVGLRVRHNPRPASTDDVSRQAAIEAARRDADERRQRRDSILAKAAAAKAEWEKNRRAIDDENRRRTELAARFADEQRTMIAAQDKAARQRADEIERRRQARATRDQVVAERRARQQEIEAEADRIKAELAALARELKAVDAEADRRRREQSEWTTALTAQEQKAAALGKATEAATNTIDQQQRNWDDARRQLDELQAEIAKLKEAKGPVKPLVHFTTPISQRAKDREAHYRCLNGRVADVPIEALLERLKERVAVREVQGLVNDTVGPIKGFTMRYLLAATMPGMAEQMQNPFSLNISLAGFEMVADSDELGEPQTAALKEGSDFRRSLALRTPRDSSVTLWVYPDAFELAKALQIYLHERGYTVAMRPLPRGVPIAASPSGSRSQVQ